MLTPGSLRLTRLIARSFAPRHSLVLARDLEREYEPVLAAMQLSPVFDVSADVGDAATSSTFEVEDLELLGTMQQEEIALAVAALGCGGGSLAQREVLEPVFEELEAEFVDQVEDQITMLKAP